MGILGDVIGGIFTGADTLLKADSLSHQKQIDDMNFQSAEKWNQANYDMQVANLEYQKALQREVFAREDSAVQRRAVDLEKAGLSKTLAAGSAANSGTILNTTAAQRGYTPREANYYKQLQNAQLMTGLMKNVEDLKYLQENNQKIKVQNDILQHDYDVLQKSGTYSGDHSALAQGLRFFSGVFGLDVDELLGKGAAFLNSLLSDSGDGVSRETSDSDSGNLLGKIVKTSTDYADVVAGNRSYNSVSPTTQALIDYAAPFFGYDEVTTLNRKGKKIPVGVRRHGYAGGTSGGANYKAVYVK